MLEWQKAPLVGCPCDDTDDVSLNLPVQLHRRLLESRNPIGKMPVSATHLQERKAKIKFIWP